MMKNIFLMIMLLFVAIALKAQDKIIEDSIVIDCSDVSEDTAYFDFPGKYVSRTFAMEFKIREALDANDATITYCGSLFPDTYNNYLSTTYPLIVDQTTILANAMQGEKNPFTYQGIMYIKNSVTDGTIVFRRLLFIPQKK